ncbi:MAG: tetraacyldisaccharide 4'-kinase [Gammaproteobacteria bacterium]|nr:tetraacyldisaccharide 4'-kinase [Gammaproteobacteria bacterium]
MSTMSQRLQQIWYGQRKPPWPLRGLARLYALWLQLRPQTRVRAQALPLLVIGNLVVGGSGKTPLVLHLASFLAQRGLRVAVIARVYQGSARHVHVLSEHSTAAQVGDEPLVLFQQLDCPVVVSRKRRYAYDYIVNNMPDIELIISDDGLQHGHFNADIGIGVVAAGRGFGNARLLPAGPLREPLSRLAKLDYLVIKSAHTAAAEQQCILPGYAASLPSQAVTMSIELRQAMRLRDGCRQPLSAFTQQAVNAVAAIADPESFFAGLRAQGLKVTGHGLPDHGQMPASLWRALPADRPLLITEKDAVKLSPERINAAAPEIWSVRLHTSLPQRFLDDLYQHCKSLTCRAA